MSTKIEFDSRKDYYAILGVNEDVTSDELKTARKNLVLQYHPGTPFSSDKKHPLSEVSLPF